MKRNNFEQQLSDELLKMALIEDAMEFLDQLPSEEECRQCWDEKNEIDKKVKKGAKDIKRKQGLRKSFRYTRKVAAIILICFGVTFVSLFSVKATRQYIIKAIWTLRDNFLELEYEEDGKADADYQVMRPTYIPMGYTQMDHFNEGIEVKRYENNKKQSLVFYFQSISKNAVSGFATDGYDIESVMIGDYVGKLFVSEENGIMLVWDDGVTQYCIDSSTVDVNEVLKIARSYR